MKLSNVFLYILTAAIFLASCKPDEFKEIGDPIMPMESISGNWKLNKVTQTDINAEEKGFPYKKLDITDVFAYKDVTFSLTLSGGAPGTFSTSNADGLDLFNSESGTWAVDIPNTPSVIYLISNNDTTSISIGSYPSLLKNALVMSIIKEEEGTNKQLIRYDYEFVR